MELPLLLFIVLRNESKKINSLFLQELCSFELFFISSSKKKLSNALFFFWLYPKYLNPNLKYSNLIRSVEIRERILYFYTKIPEYPKYPTQTRTGISTSTPTHPYQLVTNLFSRLQLYQIFNYGLRRKMFSKARYNFLLMVPSGFLFAPSYSLDYAIS